VSTILDALKKVEQDREPALSAEQLRQLDALHPTTAGRQRGGRKRIIVSVLGLMLLLMGGTALYLYNGKVRQAPSASAPDRSQAVALGSRDPKPTPAADAGKEDPTVSRRPLPLMAKPTQINKEPSNSIPAASSPDTANRSRFRPPPENPKTKDAAVNHAVPTVRPTPLPAEPSPPPTRTMPERQGVSHPLDPAPTEHRSPPSPPPETGGLNSSQQERSTPTAPSHGVLERLTDGSLKVQAIVWSPTPQERMAVLNNQIVREGDAVDDFTVVAIGPDDVVVRKDGQMWRAIFGRP
jgi:hypothetical protein